MDNELLFFSGNDIPFPGAQILIHQPRIKEIAYIGEEAFFMGCELINFSKNILMEEDKVNLEDKSDFDILIAILREQNAVMKKNKDCVEMVLALLFPNYIINFKYEGIELKDAEKGDVHLIDKNNFDEFKMLFNKICSFSKVNEKVYNPKGDLAKDIANKFNRRRQKLAEVKSEVKKVDVFSRYVSILAIGNKQDVNSLFQCTVYQLYDIFNRFQLKEANDIYIKAKMAGAKDLKEVEDWMKDIHS